MGENSQKESDQKTKPVEDEAKRSPVEQRVSCAHPNLLDHVHYNDDRNNTASYWFSCIRCKEVGEKKGKKGEAKKAFREMHN